MNDAERRALAALSFNWAPTPDDVWRPPQSHVDGLYPRTEQSVLDGLADAAGSDGASPIGVAVLGPRGSGKTHLLGWTRERAQASGGYFFLISLLDASTFWRSTVMSMLDGFTREVAGHGTQLGWFLRRLAELVGAPPPVRSAVTGEADLSRAALDAFLDLLRKTNPQLGVECQNTTRALVLRGSDNFQAQDIGHDFLCSNDEQEPGERAAWGIRRGHRTAQEIVKDMSRLLALTGPTVIAVDQIDLLIAQSAKSVAGDRVSLDSSPQERWREALLIEQIANGLMSLRESTRRTLSVVACLPRIWELVKTNATDTVQDRFREAVRLNTIPSVELGREIVARRFTARFTETGFTPPYPTWPVAGEAFAAAVDFTPRGLLKAVDGHVRSCLRDGAVRDLTDLTDPSWVDPPVPGPGQQPDELRPEVLAELDARFAALREAADPAPAGDPGREDAVVPGLLAAGLTAWSAEPDQAGGGYGQDALPGAKPALHARLRHSLDEDGEDEAHWCFRAIAADHPVAALNRIRNAVTAAGLSEGVTRRRLFLLRNHEWSGGRRTQEVLEAFEKAGGQTLPLPEDDVRTMMALRELLAADGLDTLRSWLVARRPASQIALLRAALGGEPEPDPTGGSDPSEPAVAGSDPITLGAAVDGDKPATVDLSALRKHTVIFAGSGSGKTVLIRRLVEECARHGVSAIVLDPNNDLARLGEAWPRPPAGWAAGDQARAADYLAHTDVVIWTPGRQSARPLSFQPLPDFAGVVDDPDEFRQAVDAAVAALAPRAKVDGPTNRAHLGQAVLRQALAHYGRQRRSDLRGFVSLLADLPPGVSELGNAEKLAADLSQTLTATMVNDQLFGGDGAPVDPGLLLSPPPGKRARISVISFVGLAADEQRQSFVNQLQLALFAWVKRHPAGDRPLGGLFVMDEAQTLAPSGPMTACTQSTLALTAQARKYGLGLVFATQAPKGLHNRIPGNAATQFFGLLNAPAQIGAAKELARNKGSDVPDIAQLRSGQFYAAIEGSAFVKIQAPMCLSHHPSSALTAEEVLARATAADLVDSAIGGVSGGRS